MKFRLTILIFNNVYIFFINLGGSPSKTPVNVTDVTPEHHPPGSIRRTSSVASDKDKTFEDLVKKVESSPHPVIPNKKSTSKNESPRPPRSAAPETDLDTSQQSMSDPDKSDYDDMKGGVDYDDFDQDDEYLPRGKPGGRPVRETRQKAVQKISRGRPNNNKSNNASGLLKARPFNKARGRARAKPVTINTKELEKVHR